ncbi:hypothetical protein BJ322DRAFT_346975 [Thelephora terrestris]|uniref:BTB domain-containing protein n=1 Tax=Thelephora terrestris TaxID=56493 RepID=A0A9P6H5U8_9AGAM|nr:hypothetical protein BJ322DRAFT_346975 [Thelephora terrestris]
MRRMIPNRREMNSTPRFLLDALSDSISSGIFIDTKFYVFSRREPTYGRVSSPRALYCNSRILDKVPYFSTLFSGGFSEGQLWDISGGFPTDFDPYVEDYDYLSDSDLEDGPSCLGEDEGGTHGDDGGNPQQRHENAEAMRTHQPVVPNSMLPDPLSEETIADRDDCGTIDDPPRMGKVVVIRDVGALTFEALLFFLYTDDIRFATFSSDPSGELAHERAGDWSTGKLPSPSAKSIYRLADKYNMSTLKERAMTHIRNNLEHCDIVEEVFSSFTSL